MRGSIARVVEEQSERVLPFVRHHSPVISGASRTTRSHWPESSQLRFCASIVDSRAPHHSSNSDGLDLDRILGRLPRAPPVIARNGRSERRKGTKEEEREANETDDSTMIDGIRSNCRFEAHPVEFVVRFVSKDTDRKSVV